MSVFTKLLFNFAEESLTDSLQISIYWSSAAEKIMLLYSLRLTTKLLKISDLINFI